jgi:hypothetical protein
MFNLIMAYDASMWNASPGVTGTDQFPAARLLEYTDPEIEQKLRELDSNALSFLEELPCLFMSEVKKVEESTSYVIACYGEVYNLRKINREIHYKFNIIRNFGKVQITDEKSFRSKLGMLGWELSRTHWAVKDLDLEAALNNLGLDIHPRAIDKNKPIPERKSVDPVVKNLAQFMEKILTYQIDSDNEVYFRGHSDARYQLVPSLLRRNEDGSFKYLQNEDKMFKELESAQPSAFLNEPYVIDKLVRMQHYSLPTRLLDVTANPLVALFFCCSSMKRDKNGNENDGEVIVFQTKRADIKFYDSDTVSCLSNLSLLDWVSKERLDLKKEAAEFRETAECKRLMHLIRNEKPHFQDRIEPKDLGSVVFFKARNSNDRISSQAGAFFLFGHDASLGQTGDEKIKINKIIVQQKDKILGELGRIGIKKSTIYPDLENLSVEIATKYETPVSTPRR